MAIAALLIGIFAVSCQPSDDCSVFGEWERVGARSSASDAFPSEIIQIEEVPGDPYFASFKGLDGIGPITLSRSDSRKVDVALDNEGFWICSADKAMLFRKVSGRLKMRLCALGPDGSVGKLIAEYKKGDAP